MLETAFGPAGLAPDAFWRLTWNDFDTLVYRAELERQRALEGPRLVATLLFNAHFTNKDPKNGPVVKPMSLQQFLPLSLLDPATTAKTAETPQETWARLQGMGLLD